MLVPKKKAADPSGTRSPDILTVSSPSGWPLSFTDNDSALKVTAVYRCIDYNAQTIAIMPFYIMDRYTRNRIPRHPVLSCLNIRPNEAMTPKDYKQLMEVNRLLRGNGYAYIGRNARTGFVEELLPLSPDLIKIHVDEERHLHYLYADPAQGTMFDLLPNQVIHYKAFTRDGVRGITPLTYARDVVAKDQAAKTYERALYANGGRPSGVLETDTNLAGPSEVPDPSNPGKFLSKKEVIRRAWESVHSGSDKAFRTAVLDNALKYKPIAMNNTDAQFVESNDITIADICRIFGTPLHVCMSGKQSYESNAQNRVEFVQTTALATVTGCEDEDSYKLLSTADLDKGLRIRRNMDAALRGDTKSRSEHYKIMHDIGAYSVNDIMALEDRPEVPGGDERMASLNYVPLEDFARLSLLRNGG